MKKKFAVKQHANIDTFAFTNNTAAPLPEEDREKILMCCMEYIPILDFDLGMLQGKKINGAMLYLKLAGEDFPLEVEVTSISHPWNAEFADLYNADHQIPWDSGKWFTDVIMSSGNSFYYREKAVFDENSTTIAIPIHPHLVYAMIQGQSFGIGIIDRKSRAFDTSQKRLLEIKRFYGPAQEETVPVLEIDYCEYEYTVPPAVNNLNAACTPGFESFTDASVTLQWNCPLNVEGEYLFFKLYAGGVDQDINRLTRVEKTVIPNFESPDCAISAEIQGLKPETSYRFAVSVCNNRLESKPAYVEIRTPSTFLPVVQKEQEERTASDFPRSNRVECKDFNLYILDDVGKVNPVNGCVFENNLEGYGNGCADVGQYPTGFFDGQRVQLTAAAGEKLAFQCVFENRKHTPVRLTAATGGCEADPGIISIHKIWYVKCEEGWFPEVAIPMKKKDELVIPFAENGIQGQQYQALFIDVNIPEQCAAGVYRIELKFESESDAILLPVNIQVEALQLDPPGFVFELMGYRPAPGFMDCKYGDEDYLTLEEVYYRTAFFHGLNVNILPYMQSGKVHEGFAPVVEIRDDIPEITGWSEWDRHFSRYLNGTYLQGHHEKNVPVPCIFVPFNENWPMPIEKYYKVKVSTIRYPEMVNESKLKSTAVRNDFPEEYREGIKKIFKDFIRHTDEKGWGDRQFVFYLNNKHYWKNRELSGQWGKYMEAASSWWLLDEPLIRDDWEAVAYYGEILKEAREEMKSGYNFRFRVDISRYHLMFDSLDHLMDLACLGTLSFQKKASLARVRKRKFGEEFWVYGTLNPINKSNMEMCVNLVNIFGAGGRGFVPWDNYGKDEAYETPTATAGLYPGNRFGLKGPAVSLRLKAARKGIQLIRYLQTLKNEYKLNDLQVHEYISDFVNTAGKAYTESMEDAGVLRYELASANSLERMKQDIVRRLKDRRMK